MAMRQRPVKESRSKLSIVCILVEDESNHFPLQGKIPIDQNESFYDYETS